MFNVVICIIVWGLSFKNNITNSMFIHVILFLCLTLTCFAFEMNLPNSTSLSCMEPKALIFALAFTWFFHKYFWIIMSSECPISFDFKALSHSLIDDVNNFPIQFYLFNIFCKYTNSNMTLEHTVTYNSV